MILNAYIPTLQTPGAVAWFLREVCGTPILSPVVFKRLTDRFVAAVERLAAEHRVPVLRPRGRLRPRVVAQQALRRAARANRWGVVAIVVHQESARVFAGYHAGGRASHFRVKEDRRLVNHYNFYLRNRTSRSAVRTGCSPGSQKPPGTSQQPFQGSWFRLTSKSFPSRVTSRGRARLRVARVGRAAARARHRRGLPKPRATRRAEPNPRHPRSPPA